jgi:hypothetical protein
VGPRAGLDAETRNSRLSWNPKFQCRDHKIPPLVSIQSRNIHPSPMFCWFYGEDLLDFLPIPMLEDNPKYHAVMTYG